MLSSLLFYVSDLSIALIYTLILIFVNLFTPIFIGLDTLWHTVIKLQSCFSGLLPQRFWLLPQRIGQRQQWTLTHFIINTWFWSKKSSVFQTITTNWYNQFLSEVVSIFIGIKNNLKSDRLEVLTSHSGSAPSVWMSSRWKTTQQVDFSGRSIETFPFLLHRRKALCAPGRNVWNEALVFQRKLFYIPKQIYRRRNRLQEATGGEGFIRVISPHPGKKVSSVPACAARVCACVLKFLKSCTCVPRN